MLCTSTSHPDPHPHTGGHTQWTNMVLGGIFCCLQPFQQSNQTTHGDTSFIHLPPPTTHSPWSWLEYIYSGITVRPSTDPSTQKQPWNGIMSLYVAGRKNLSSGSPPAGLFWKFHPIKGRGGRGAQWGIQGHLMYMCHQTTTFM